MTFKVILFQIHKFVVKYVINQNCFHLEIGSVTNVNSWFVRIVTDNMKKKEDSVRKKKSKEKMLKKGELEEIMLYLEEVDNHVREEEENLKRKK